MMVFFVKCKNANTIITYNDVFKHFLLHQERTVLQVE